MTTPGWYPATGDPPGTQRWWDGEIWIGEPVPIPAPAASATPSAGNRIAARLIDLIIMALILMLLVLLGLGTPEFSGDGINVDVTFGNESLDSPLEYVLWGIVSFTWSTLWIKRTGATPGKKLLKLEVVDQVSGDPVSGRTAAVRSANKLLPIAGIISVDTGEVAVVVVGTTIIGVISLVLLLVDKEGRTIMDRLSGAKVVKNQER